MDMDLTTQILRAILWYHSKDIQHLIIPSKFSEELYRLDITSNNKVCGVSFEVGNVDKVTAAYNLEDLGKNTGFPSIPLKLIQFKTAGVVGYSLYYLAQKGKVKYKKDIYSLLTKKVSKLYCTYSPSKVITSLNWGFGLLFAYLAARESIEVDLYVSMSNKRVPNNWDEQSKLMAGELLTELDINVIEKPTRHLCRLSSLLNCDYFIYGTTEKDNNSFFLKKAKEFNKPIVRVETIDNAE